jgi:hypothetical protein
MRPGCGESLGVCEEAWSGAVVVSVVGGLCGRQAECIEPWPTSPQFMAGVDQDSIDAEVDGNRTRRTRITRPNRFEGGGAHQVPGHLHTAP